MITGPATPQRIGNVLTADKLLLRMTICGVEYIRDALTGDLVVKFPSAELDASDEKVMRMWNERGEGK